MSDRNRDKCPKCKCKKVDAFNHPVDPPEQWTEYNCANCNFLVGLVDNSPYMSCYDFENFIING